MARSIQSPGVEIIEKDLSLSPVLPAGTNIFITGFAAKGPTDEILQITSVDEFEQVYGTPTNSAERYFYYGAKQVLNGSNGNLFVSRLPYGDGTGEGYGSTYGALVYPIVSVWEDQTSRIARNTTTLPATAFNDTFGFILTGLQSSPTLSAQLPSLTANGLQTYRTFTTAERRAIVTEWENIYNFTFGTSLCALGEYYHSLVQYVISSYETKVTTDLTKDNATYIIGAPKFFDLSLSEYQGAIDGSGFSNSNYGWSTDAATNGVSSINSVADFGKAGLVVVNKIQSTINNRWEGHYIGLADNTNLEPNSDYTSIRQIYTNGTSVSLPGMAKSQMQVIPTTKLSFPLSASIDAGNNRNSSSLSEALEKVSYPFPDIATSIFDDTISFGLFKLRTSPYNPDAITLGYSFEESKIGSFDYYRQINNVNGGIPNSFYIENIMNRSNSINTFINSTINGKANGSWLDVNGVPKRKVRILSNHSVEDMIRNNESNWSKYGFHLSNLPDIRNIIDYADALFPVGSYSSFSVTGKNIGSLPFKLDRTLRKIENDELFDLDLVLENGLGTIHASMCANETPYFDDVDTKIGLKSGIAAICENEPSDPNPAKPNWNVRDNYNTIFNIFDTFCTQLRKDCMFISDPLRGIFVTGANNLTLADPTKAFSKFIYNPLKNLYSNSNTSYGAAYANWCKINDAYSGMNIWVPFSPFAAADIANVDRNFEPWYAPAGFTRGKITNALQLAIAPKQKERDMLYKISMNPVAFFPNDGMNIFGQKTLLRQPSAFDRINVRRLFLYLEKATKRTVKYFVFEPNTLYTRNRVLAVLNPIFDRARNSQGLYEYQIVCDKRNNTPEVIDRNELIVDIYLKPVRSAEFILVNFYATSTGTNFSEIIGV